MEQPRATAGTSAGGRFDYRTFVTWLATAVIAYELLSGLAVTLLPFGTFVQYSVLVHTAVGLAALMPLPWAILRHYRRRSSDELPPEFVRTAVAAWALLGFALVTGLLAALQGFFGIEIWASLRWAHLLAAVALGLAIGWHLLPLVQRYRSSPPTPVRPLRRRYVGVGALLAFVLLALPAGLAGLHDAPSPYRAFGDDYDWPYGEDHPFWPSRAALADPPWKTEFIESLAAELDAGSLAAFEAELSGPRDRGIRELSRRLAGELELDAQAAAAVEALAEQAALAQRVSGALDPAAMTGSAGCGTAGCHQAIYEEWQASAHGYSATDVLFLQVQKLLADSKGPAETRSCAGCHDPVALFSGARHDNAPMGDGLKTFEGNSCLVCHSTVRTDTEGNGGFVLAPPARYLFEYASGGFAAALNRFLIRAKPDDHTATYKRALYRESEFCAGCHKQVPAPGEATSAGFAQEQNEYDSWRQSRWYHGDDNPRTIECRECHMPLVPSNDPASGDDVDPYRSPGDGMHRSHRVLASNMYIPLHMDIPGGDEQARLTVEWLQGNIEVPEIADKWASGPVVELDIVAPETIAPGELVNIKLHLHNNKTGHDFPAGPLDVLESWVELTVEDENGNRLLELGTERSVSPSIDAPVVYKADWYDRQGLPVERHNLWDVVGASYRRVIRSGGSDVIDVPFRCPGIGRPRLSQSASEDGPGERSSDVVFSIDEADIGELVVTARLLFRKANPDFLATVYEFEPVAQAPVIELVRNTHTIRVTTD